MEYIALQVVFLPLLLSPLAYILGKKLGPTITMWFAFSILAYCTLLIIHQFVVGDYEEHYVWTELFGEFGFLFDGLSSIFAIVIYLLCTILALYSKPYMIHKFQENFNSLESNEKQLGSNTQSMIVTISKTEYVNKQSGIYFALYLVFAMGMLGTVLATNLIEFYIFFEVMLIPAFFLLAFYGDGDKRRISLMFFFWTHVGAVILLLGFLVIGLNVGSFDFADIDESKIPNNILLLSAIAIIIGLGVKLAAFMFHIWLPYAHGAAPTPISALLSPAMIGIGAYGLFRLIIEFLPNAYHELAIWLHIWGLVTMIYGGIMALMQDDIKRLFAYSSISQMGYILFGIGSYSVLGMTGAEMMYITHALGKGLLFMTAGILIVQVKTRSISKLGGLASKLPITAVCAVIGALTIMGVPPTSGFMGEWMLFYGSIDTAIDQDSPLRIIIFSLGLISTVITMSYMLWMLKRVFFGKLPETLTHVKEGNWYMLSPMIVLAVLTIIVGIYPDIFLNDIVPYMNEITTKILNIN
ncbi:MAG: NADH-quinone oxidoreductase subunit M [Thaumarchaeota archaeon]|nr:NADH-quinone oxidoreductase subunit M [Nitrososphaerota archaeon]